MGTGATRGNHKGASHVPETEPCPGRPGVHPGHHLRRPDGSGLSRSYPANGPSRATRGRLKRGVVQRREQQAPFKSRPCPAPGPSSSRAARPVRLRRHLPVGNGALCPWDAQRKAPAHAPGRESRNGNWPQEDTGRALVLQGKLSSPLGCAGPPRVRVRPPGSCASWPCRRSGAEPACGSRQLPRGRWP